MSSITKLIHKGAGLAGRRLLVCLAALAAMFAPTMALAGEGDVTLKFSQSDNVYLGISFLFGLIAVGMAFWIRSSVLAQSPGNEKMQEVGLAIREGALAYLRQQIRTMIVFIVLLAVALFLIYQNFYPTLTALWVAVSFVGGVAASYIAGYTGMMMAVNGNMRTANAALTSYKRSLETAFRSGAVAGLVTVGMGLIGATLILFLAREDAMKLLVGFGFGGSLAALFMRVGGGIFTKAADVGADLVGKVEAGIPEDDPRNPATIADNVGDNVGDCAGMAADIFESYEVTLVAAIVLGAATSAIFDSTTWMKLILFALMARGVGIIASILGIAFVKGTDDVDSDPLKPITRGFMGSAAIAAVLTAVLAFVMMGGMGSPIATSKLKGGDEYRQAEFQKIKQAQKDIADKKYGGDLAKVTPKDFKELPVAKELQLDKDESDPIIQNAFTMSLEDMPEPKKLTGFTRVDFEDEKNPVLNYTVTEMPTTPGGEPKYVPFKQFAQDQIKNKRLQVLHLKLTQTPPPTPNQRTPPKPMTREIYYGPIDRKTADEQIKQARQNRMEIEIVGQYLCEYLSNSKGEIAVGIGPKIDEKGNVLDSRTFAQPHKSQGGMGLSYYKEPASEVAKMMEARKTDFNKPMPRSLAMATGSVEHTVVPWWKFFVCILFGVLMAFAFERLTDYYVSTHKKPVKEVASVATAGPATMIIQGFAYGLESSVFSVFAIVAALIMPMVIFPPAEYGGYILSFYGIALVGLGLLTTTGYILAMDTFGPISDNAQGVFEMSGCGHGNENANKAVQRLDAAGNTTKALTKGFAIATAVVAAVALFHSYVEGARLTDIGMRIELPEIFLGLLIGGAAPYLFSAFSINAVGRAAFELINEVRRQFRADAGIMAGTSKPDYGRCVAIVTAAAQKELLGPGVLAVFFPVAVAFGFGIASEPVMVGGVSVNLGGAQALGGFLAGTILSGQLMAVLLANSGGMWDNAKKLIEDGLHGGKGTDAHKAGVVCDTVGDPFKDTAGPALNPLIKVMNLISLLLAPVVITPMPKWIMIVVTVGAILFLLMAFWWSKRGSMSTGLQAAVAQTDASALGGSTVSAPAEAKAEEKD